MAWLTWFDLRAGMSANGAWSHAQLRLIGVPLPPKSGWQRRAIGNYVPDSHLATFVRLKSACVRQGAKRAAPASAPQPALVARPMARPERAPPANEWPPTSCSWCGFEQISRETTRLGPRDVLREWIRCSCFRAVATERLYQNPVDAVAPLV